MIEVTPSAQTELDKLLADRPDKTVRLYVDGYG